MQKKMKLKKDNSIIPLENPMLITEFDEQRDVTIQPYILEVLKRKR